MKNWNLYRFLLHFLPVSGKITSSDLPIAQQMAAEKILRRFRCVGATICLYDEKGVTGTLAFGRARRGGAAADRDTVYRAASVSKLISAMGAMKLVEEGALSLEADVNDYLPFSLRHPQAKDRPLTLKMLLSHLAGIHDGDAYNQGIGQGKSLSEILAGDSFCDHLPGTTWEYSNLGAGIAGVVAEAATKTDFETLMQKTVFQPLGVEATYYPQKVKGMLADAYRILPAQKAPNFDAEKRKKRPMAAAQVDAEYHYALAHGNLCIAAPELAKLGMALLRPGFLRQESLLAMRKIQAPFGERAGNLSQGIGTFILQEKKISSHPIYGHQGMAYGAVHGLFFDPRLKRGMVLLTSGASEARNGVLADLNFHLIRLFLGEG